MQSTEPELPIADETLTGYLHPSYSESLSEFGAPHLLTRSRGWILDRAIAGTPYRDAMGCYPLFSCADWEQLRNDIEGLGAELTSLVVVTDPFGNYTEESLRGTFKDLTKPFKEHFVVDLSVDPGKLVHSHHQRNARKALEVIQIERCEAEATCLEDWNNLYANLIARHDIRGIARFSKATFARQLSVPGSIMLRATHEGQVVGMTWWFVSRGVGYYHLGAYSDAGYELRASFALFWRALELLKEEGLHWLDLGAGAGLGNDATDGLSRFKRGWSTGTRTAFLCGRIFDHNRYKQIADAKGIPTTDYFPAYRQGEFV